MIRANTVNKAIEVEVNATGAEALSEMTALMEGLVRSAYAAHKEQAPQVTIEMLLDETITHIYKRVHNKLCGTVVSDPKGVCSR